MYGSSRPFIILIVRLGLKFLCKEIRQSKNRRMLFPFGGWWMATVPSVLYVSMFPQPTTTLRTPWQTSSNLFISFLMGICNIKRLVNRGGKTHMRGMPLSLSNIEYSPPMSAKYLVKHTIKLIKSEDIKQEKISTAMKMKTKQFGAHKFNYNSSMPCLWNVRSWQTKSTNVMIMPHQLVLLIRFDSQMSVLIAPVWPIINVRIKEIITVVNVIQKTNLLPVVNFERIAM